MTSSRFTVWLLLIALSGCGGKTARTTDTDSTEFATLDEKKAFLERYVNFRRTYEELEFDITYTDGGGGRVPGPTEWDIRLAAKVPGNGLDEWIAGLETKQGVDTTWVSRIPKAPDKLDGFEWATDGDRLVGIDPKQRLVVYWNVSR